MIRIVAIVAAIAGMFLTQFLGAETTWAFFRKFP
jgi:hypothetical protein